MTFPSPHALGLPAHYTDWRMHQADAILEGHVCPKRVHMAVAPTGAGKSAIAIAIANMQTGRTCILTATKALEYQYGGDFKGMVVIVTGMNAHPCKLVHGETDCSLGMCHFGVRCNYKDNGCGYYDQLRRARAARIVVTNYHFWCANNRLPNASAQDKIGAFDLLVCDEAHSAPSITADQFTVEFTHKRWVDDGLLEGYPWGGGPDAVYKWLGDGQMACARATDRLKTGLSAGGAGGRVKQLAKWTDAAKRLAEARLLVYRHIQGKCKALIIGEKADGRVRVAPLWPYADGGRLLFANVPNVIMMSATVRPKTARLLGLGDDDFELLEYPHTFPVRNRQLLWLPTVRVNKDTPPMELRLWQMRIDQILRTRMHWNGLIHSVSYGRAEGIVAKSQYAGDAYLFTHERGKVDEAVELMKMRLSPRGLVSPSVSTGFNFPGDECRFQIITKLPFPDMRDALTRARCDEDEELAPYHTMTELVQACGRPVRSNTDWAESFCIDDNLGWFAKRYKDMAPGWWVDGVRTLRRNVVPDAGKIQ